jgi:hypothetical protein
MTGIPSTISTVKPLIIPSNSSFYCLIGTLSGANIHTFFQMGYVDEDNKSHPLLEIGKVPDEGLKYNDGTIKAVANALFSKTGAVIKNEKRLLRESCFTDLSFEMSYSAYKINSEHYFYFLNLLKQIEISNIKFFNEQAHNPAIIEEHNNILEERLFAYIPTGNNNEYIYDSILCWEDNFNLTEDITKKRQNLVGKASELSINNTCRHTGIDFLYYILDSNTYGPFNNVPAFFMKGMPCSTTMNSGGYTSNLYLLPLPPNTYILTSSQSKTLEPLYRRMEILLQKDFDHPNTRQKFNLLNSIYENLVSDLKPEVCFLSILVEHSLKPENKEVIDTHRGWHWPLFHQTKTHQMFEQFQRELNIQSSQL